MSKSWLIGFTEAESRFGLRRVNKSKNKIVHAFEISPKLDEIVLLAIKYILHISTNVQFKDVSISRRGCVSSQGYYTLVTTNSRAIENIIFYFKNTFKGMKSIEFRIWSRSYVKNKGNFLALNKIRENVRIMQRSPSPPFPRVAASSLRSPPSLPVLP
jgi:LAGLIDADG endonuclease